MGAWRLWIRRTGRRIWFRAALISVISVLLALASAALAPFISYEFSLKVGSDSVDNILTILASSMLAVTTFSLTAMVAAFSRAAQHVTPRASQLLIEDKTAQNALSTFLGAFLFAIVGLIALSTGFYGAQGRVILLFGTIALIGWIAVVLLRWIDSLTQFGRVEDAIRRVEKAAIAAIRAHPGSILLAGRSNFSPPEGANTIDACETGYVIAIDRERIEENLPKDGGKVHINAPVGAMVTRGQPLAWSDSELEPDQVERIGSAFILSAERSFDEDSRFGLSVLAEIASRALSPAVNDPGTALSVLNAGQRVFEAIADARPCPSSCTSIVEPPLELESLLEDLVLPIARDGKAMVEVGIRLQHMLGAIATQIPPAEPAIRHLASDALERAQGAEIAARDLRRIERAHNRSFD